MTTPLAFWPSDFSGAHSLEAACQSSTGPDLTPLRWLDTDPDLPHPLVVEALDELLMHGQMTAARGIASMTEYRLGALCGIRTMAIATGMWSGHEMALLDECETMISAWNDAAKAIAAKDDQRRAQGRFGRR